TLHDFGMVDDANSAYALAPKLKAADLDLIFCDMLTYATSSTFGVILREVNAPIVLVALQPMQAMDYDRASTYMQLCNDDFCSVPEFSGVAARMGKRIPDCVIGVLDGDPDADQELESYCRIAHALHDLKRARIGLMGHVLEAMLDMHSDPTQATSAFGCHVVQCEPHDVYRFYRDVSDHDIEVEAKEILGFFDTPEPVSDPITTKLTENDLRIAAKASLALNRFIDEKQLDGLAYYYEGEPGSDLRRMVTNFIVGNSMLIAAGFPMCGEYDLKTCIAMLIMDRLEMGGSFAEFHPIDFREGFILVGHDGPHHLNIAQGKPVLRSLLKYHGKPGSGASVEFKLAEGPITMLGLNTTFDGRFKFVIAEGESVQGPIPPTGNTNTRGFFQPDVKTFLRRWIAEGPTHHFALGLGHRAKTLQTLADYVGAESVVISKQP
ncbi:L-fucose/L-arabinose isomerase family protein, partial [bacterium]|nr:L-fucose/L-arabinose isomerase family protein [bacterium]